MISLELLFLAFIGFIGGLALIYYSYVTFKHYHLIRDTPTSKIQSLPLGYVEIEGTAKPYENLQPYSHPISGDDVLYYDLHIEKKVNDGDDNHWRTVTTEEKGEKIVVDDTTGEVEVEIDDPRFEFADDDSFRERYTLNPDTDAPGVLKEYDVHDSILPDAFDGERYQVTVYSIDEGETVYVFGDASNKPDAESSVNEENIVIENPNVNESFADRIDEEYSDLLGALANDGTPLIISTKPEGELIKSYRWKIPTSFFGGLILSSGSLYILLSAFL